jgi:Domain of unknown function (DUF4263)
LTGEFSQADEAAMEQRLRRFCKTYYAELRQRMAEYPAASEIFPYDLTGYRRIIATLTKDGIVMVHWFAEKDTFEFRSSPDKRVTDLTEELAIVYPNGMKAVQLPRDPDDPEKDFNAAVTVVAPEAYYGDQIIRPDWVRLDAAATYTLDGDLYTEERARDEATKDVLLEANAYLMGLTHVPPDQRQDKVLAELGAAIDEFERLLASDPEEWRLQMFLGLPRNKILLDPSAKSVTPEVKLADQYRIDFVLELPQLRHVLVEIERPRDELYTESEGDPARRHKHGLQQIMNWIEWLDENKDFARKNIPVLSKIKEPEYRLVVGLRRNTSEEHQKKLTRKNAEHHRIETMTFDDLLDRAKQYLENLRQLT